MSPLNDVEFILDGALNEVTRTIAAWRTSQGADTRHHDPLIIRSRLMGISSELGEAYNATRPEKQGDLYKLREEMADVFIRWAGFVGFMGWDIETDIADKLDRLAAKAEVQSD